VAKPTDRPYGAFNFLVSIGGIDGQEAQAGFSEVSGLSTEIEVIEYRAGNYISETPVKIPGLTKYSPVVLKRGLIGSLELYEWLKESGHSESDSRRDVVIHLLNDEHEPVFTWKLSRAWISKYSVSDLKASSSEIAIESIELVHEGLRIE
jgi:phage tail-like protein